MCRFVFSLACLFFTFLLEGLATGKGNMSRNYHSVCRCLYGSNLVMIFILIPPPRSSNSQRFLKISENFDNGLRKRILSLVVPNTGETLTFDLPISTVLIINQPAIF